VDPRYSPSYSLSLFHYHQFASQQRHRTSFSAMMMMTTAGLTHYCGEQNG
jgi:hypothetical protein